MFHGGKTSCARKGKARKGFRFGDRRRKEDEKSPRNFLARGTARGWRVAGVILQRKTEKDGGKLDQEKRKMKAKQLYF